MMDAAQAVWPQIVAALKSDAALVALNGGRIYDRPPPPGKGARKMPCTTRGPSQTLPFTNDGDRGCSVSVQIDNWSETTEAGVYQPRAANEMNAAVCAALFGEDCITAPAGWLVQGVWPESSEVIADPDGVTAHGIVRVRIELTPSGVNDD